MAKPNHGQNVSGVAHAAQAERTEGAERGIGSQVSVSARDRSKPDEQPDFEDGVITVITDDGRETMSFSSFADALAYSNDGDTLQVGAGVYKEALNLDERVTIVGEEGAVIDGSEIASTTGTQSTIQLFDGFSGGSISGLMINAIDGGQAVLNNFGEDVNDVTLSDNIFDAGANTSGSLLYFNPGADGFTIDGNRFEGASLTTSPLLGIEGDDFVVSNNFFGDTPKVYPKVGISEGSNGTTEDVVLTGNSGLSDGDVFWG